MLVVVQLILLWLVVFFLIFWVYSLQEKLKEQDTFIEKLVDVVDKIVDRISK